MLLEVSRPSHAAFGLAIALTTAACGATSASPIAAESPSPETSTETTETAPSPKAEPPPPPIAWETSDPDARARAKRSALPLLVYLRADWSAASLHQEREIWTDPRVIRAARSFVALRIDLSSTAGDADGYLARYAVSVVPTTILYDTEGRRFAALSGEIDVSPLLAALTSVD